jgi:uncharacterized repeat protein (TIGR03803 family)
MKTKLLSIIIVFFTLTSNAQTYMYGTTSEGGANNLGTIYRVDENGQNFQKLFDFTTFTGGLPNSGLTLANNGKLYGFTTLNGQIVNPGATIALGSFFEFDPLTNTLNVIEYIDDQSEIGMNIYHSPLLASDNKLYFTSENINFVSAGVISSYDPSTSVMSVLDTFDTQYFGVARSKLMEASNGHLYVTTSSGGLYSKGAIVRWNTTGLELERMHSSQGYVFGQYEEYELSKNNILVEASDGFLYGCSRQGGEGVGNIFKINLDGTGYQSLYSFVAGIAGEGFFPTGMIEKNGKLYGSLAQEQIQNQFSGGIFYFDLATQLPTFLYSLDLEGSRPLGTFVESFNGRLYLTCNGGNIDNGSLIELNTLNNIVTQRHAFNPSTGVKPIYDNLCLVDFTLLSINESSQLENFVNTYPNPIKEILNVKSESTLQIETIKILDLKGSELYMDESKTKESVINTSFLSSGVYLLYIKTNTGSLTRKIVKE